MLHHLAPLFSHSLHMITLSNNCQLQPAQLSAFAYVRGVKLIFTGCHMSLTVAFKGPNVILDLCKCNYSLPRGKELGTAAG